MASFKDKDGRTWVLALDAPTIRTVRAECDGLDLADVEGKAFSRLVDDPCLLVDVLWVLCRKQAQSAGVTDEQFGRALVGDSLESATTAMLESIADFFPSRKRELLKALAGRGQTLRELGMKRAMERLSDKQIETKLMDRLDAMLDAELARVLAPSSSVTNTPDSSASRPSA